ncbi:hypothetical protein ACHMW6_20515 [Pseudoduganella sp. UC29_106]|uniref:hypothetical protein n=1 Tax=Pseudoduganella sp. UC29_106 TaxID=3374553 RepID=UPI003756330C
MQAQHRCPVGGAGIFQFGQQALVLQRQPGIGAVGALHAVQRPAHAFQGRSAGGRRSMRREQHQVGVAQHIAGARNGGLLAGALFGERAPIGVRVVQLAIALQRRPQGQRGKHAQRAEGPYGMKLALRHDLALSSPGRARHLSFLTACQPGLAAGISTS